MHQHNLSFLILAGGKSRRMGINKADLDFNGHTFLETLVIKARAMGFADIIISGYAHDVMGITPVADEIPDCGPLGGMYSAFKTAKNEFCFVVTVDVPDLVEDTIFALIDAHFNAGNALTLLCQHDKPEPLIGIYPTACFEKIYPLITTGQTKVFRLIDQYDYQLFEAPIQNETMANINTPDDYERFIRTKSSHQS
jgi:molybdopterin-guanine dinucleotide biosynthesis protein A